MLWKRKRPRPLDPDEVLRTVRQAIEAGRALHMDQLSREEMAAAGTLISQGVARIGSRAIR